MRAKFTLALFAVLLGGALNAAQFRTQDKVAEEYKPYMQSWAVDFSDSNLRAAAKKRQDELAASTTQPTASLIAPANGDQPAVPLYLYRSKNAPQLSPLIYFIHGGGYLMGNAKSKGARLMQLANELNATVASVEYRLASVAPFPADLNDAYNGLKYLFENAKSLGLDRRKVVVMGEGAGGGLAARLALYARDKGELSLAGQVLVYPMLDHRTGGADSIYDDKNTGEFVWTAAANVAGWTALRGGQAISEEQMPYFSPALAKNLRGLPQVFMVTGELDLFVHEDIDYANRLLANGVSTELLVIPNVFHSFDSVNENSPQTKLYFKLRNEAIKRMFKAAK